MVHLQCATALYCALWTSCHTSGSEKAGKIQIWDSIAQFSFGEISQWSVELLSWWYGLHSWANDTINKKAAAAKGSKYFWLEHFYTIPCLNTALSLRLYAKQWMAFILSLLTKMNKAKATNWSKQTFSLYSGGKKSETREKKKKKKGGKNNTNQQQQMLCFRVLQKFWLHSGHFTEFLSQGAWTLHFGPADRH